MSLDSIINYVDFSDEVSLVKHDNSQLFVRSKSDSLIYHIQTPTPSLAKDKKQLVLLRGKKSKESTQIIHLLGFIEDSYIIFFRINSDGYLTGNHSIQNEKYDQSLYITYALSHVKLFSYSKSWSEEEKVLNSLTFNVPQRTNITLEKKKNQYFNDSIYVIVSSTYQSQRIQIIHYYKDENNLYSLNLSSVIEQTEYSSSDIFDHSQSSTGSLTSDDLWSYYNKTYELVTYQESQIPDALVYTITLYN